MNLLSIARELEAIAQAGLHFARDPFDLERYQRIRGLAADLMAGQSNLQTGEILAWSASEFGYATPKVDVRAFITAEDRVLLVRENLDGGRWTLPGGWADVNHSPSENVIREVREESGYEAEVVRLLAVLDREKHDHPPPFPYHIYKMFFQCRITGGTATPNIESSESAFFPIDALPELSLSRILPGQLAKLHQLAQEEKPGVWCD